MQLETQEHAEAIVTDLTSEAPLSAAERQEVAESASSSERQIEAIDPDAQATADFLAGSEQAFIQLYAKYEAPLLLYCKRMLSNERIAEDAFQELWIKVFELRQRKDIVVTCFRALLFRSARNLCLNMLRLETLRAGSSDMLREMTATSETSASMHESEIKTLIKDALAKLPFDQREAFVLHEYSGYSYAEIATIMNTNEVNVKVRAYRARLRLKKLIQSWLGLGEHDDPSSVI